MDQASLSIIILIVAMVLFFTEIFPVQFTAMGILITFILIGILEPQEAFAGLTDSSVLLFTAMFIVGDALFITGVADRIGQFIIKYAKTERRAILLVMLVAGGASAFLSNTGTTAIFIPIIIGISRTDGFSRSRLMMPLCLAATMGGAITLLGTTPNIIISSAMEDAGLQAFGIFDFTPFALPLFLVGVAYYVLFAYRWLPKEDSTVLDSDQLKKYEKELDHSNIPSWKRIMSVLVLIFTVLGMIFSNHIEVPFYVIAWIGALVLVFTRVISASEAIDAMDWSSVLLITGTLSIGTALDKTGAGALIADKVLSVVGTEPIIVVGAIMLITIVLSNFMSNTATAALMAPIGISIASGLSIQPAIILMAIAMGSAFSYGTPFGSPPNTMVYGLGGYEFSDYTKVGIPLMIINFFLTLFLVNLLYT